MDKEIEYCCPSCGKDLAAGGVEIREVEHHAYSGKVAFSEDGEAYVEGDAATDHCDDVDGRYAMCGHCFRVLDGVSVYF